MVRRYKVYVGEVGFLRHYFVFLVLYSLPAHRFTMDFFLIFDAHFWK